MINDAMYQLGAKRSCIRELFEYGLIMAQKVGKENVFDYSLGNPSVPAPDGVNRSIESLTETESSLSLHGYTPAGGCGEVRAAVAAELTERFHMPIRPDNLFFTCGAAPALVSTFRALAVASAEIVAIAPYFPEYPVFVASSGAKLVTVPADLERFQIRMDELEKRITQHTQGVIVNSPNNPSGAVYSRETLTALAALLTEKSRAYGHPIYIISDEPYRELVYDGVEVPFLPAIYPNTVVCYSYSKSLSLPGERIGYVLVPDWGEEGPRVMAAVMGAARASGHVCAPSLLQKVISRCTRLRPDLNAYDRSRLTLYRALTEYGYSCVRPEGAFYLFVRAPGGDAAAFSERAKERNLLIVPGNDFGCPEYFRLSTCVSYDMILRSLPVFKELIEAE